MIPLATHTISVLSPSAADLDAEPYSGEDDRVEVVASGIRAVIDAPSGREQIAGGEQAIWDFELVCDPQDSIARWDQIKDEATGVIYRVVWVWLAPEDHIEAGLRLVQGEV
ncbi:MAG: hypothetical protein ABWX96_13545 [Propionibacteriaceae bacterium]